MSLDRTTGLGASEVAAAIGLSPYQTPLDLWLRKTKRAEPQEETPAMRWGTMLEPIILDWYEYETSTHVAFRQQRRPVEGPIWATLDGIAMGEQARVVEAKSAGWSRGWGDPGSGVVPVQYLIQVQVQMRAASLPVADVVATVAGKPPAIWTVPEDRELQSMAIEQALAFWRLVETDTPPDARTGAELRKLMDVLHPVDTTEIRLANAEGEALAYELRHQQRIAKEAGELVEWTAGKLKRVIGDAAGIEGPFGKITWKANKAGSRVFRCAWAEDTNGEEG